MDITIHIKDSRGTLHIDCEAWGYSEASQCYRLFDEQGKIKIEIPRENVIYIERKDR